MHFSPTHPGLYVARVVALDDKVGSRTFEVRGIALLPTVSEEKRFVT